MNQIIAGVCALLVCFSSVAFVRCHYNDNKVNAEVYTYENSDKTISNVPDIEVKEND